jgi:triacylglycerol lipase
MPCELYEDEFGDPRNAHTLATASDLAYLPEAQGTAAFREQLGLEAKLFSSGNTQCYVATNADHIVAAFRGTEAPTSIEGLKDWLLTDAVNLLIMPKDDIGTDFAAAGVGTRWHQGFIRALNEIWDPVFAAVQAERKKSDRPLWVTGHSLGGALAMMAGWRFKRKFVPVHQIYTYGAPMVGDVEASAAIDREFGKKVYRYVNDQDPVPRLPTVSLMANEYGHCQKEVLLGAVAVAGAAVAAGVSPFAELAKKAAGGALQGTLVDDLWKTVHERIGAHAMALYLSRVAELFKKTS